MNKIYIPIYFLLMIVGFSCTDPYKLESTTFEEALVVEATITNEIKKQSIRISRTYPLGGEGPVFEAGADVTVTDDQGNEYQFEQQGDVYLSASPFGAESGRNYKLQITTADGREYASTDEVLSPIAPIADVTPVRKTINGQDGVQILVSSGSDGNAMYYRYEYEETFKIFAPQWSEFKTVVLNPGPSGDREIIIVPREEETRTCYSTNKSTDLLLVSTQGLGQSNVEDFPVNFISRNDHRIRERYSILVRQYVQNRAAYTFLQTMKDLSSSGGVLSPVQPGFFFGNIRSVNDPTEKVIGFFEVSSVSEKRIFFNFQDVISDGPLPPYPYTCELKTFDLTPGTEDYEQIFASLFGYISANMLVFYNYDDPFYEMAEPECGDCTTFSSNVVPEFWED